MRSNFTHTAHASPLPRSSSIDMPQVQAQRMRVDWDYLRHTLFVLPYNDGEAVRAVQILRALPAPYILCSQQRWGAVLEKEMPALRASLNAAIKTVCIVEIPGQEVDAAGRLKCEQELRQRGLQVDIIDHHFYHWIDRSHELSSLEQLCAKINWQLSDFDLHVAVNDRAWIPGLLALGLTTEQVSTVRAFDLQAQGHLPAKIVAHTEAARHLLAAGQLQAQEGVYVLEKSMINSAVLSQELALRHEDGKVNIFIGRKHKVSFSGQPTAVDALRQVDLSNLGYPIPYTTYGGGDRRFSKFFGLKSTASIEPACHARLLKKIRLHLSNRGD